MSGLISQSHGGLLQSMFLQRNPEEALRLRAAVGRALLEGTAERVRMRRSVTRCCTRRRSSAPPSHSRDSSDSEETTR